MSPDPPSRDPAKRGPSVWPRTASWLLAGALALAPPSAANDERVTLRVNDSEAAPGGVATVVIRTYSPRPVGQGQISLGTSARPRLTFVPRGDSIRRPGSVGVVSPFTELLDVDVLSGESDASLSFTFSEEAGLQLVFASASGTINESDGPMVILRFRVSDQVLPGDVYELALDPGDTTLTAPDGAVLEVDPRSGDLEIEDDAGGGGGGEISPGRLRFDLRTYTVAEGAGTAIVTLERSQGDDGAVSVSYLTRDGSAGVDDYQASSGTVSWADGDEGVKTFQVPIVDDSVDEPSETVLLELESPTGGASLDFDRSTAVLTILDDDEPSTEPQPTEAGSLRFRTTRVEVAEGAASAILEVERIGGFDGSVAIAYLTVDGSAERGLDYLPSSGTLGWADLGGGVELLEVPLLDDDVDEGNESFRVRLESPTGGATLDPGAREAEVVILDDDREETGCVSSRNVLCLQNGRFSVEAVWFAGDGASGRAVAVPDSESAGLFWFFERSNVEMLFKVLDGCSVANLEGWWVFFSATTDLGLRVSVTDTVTGQVKEYTNSPGVTAPPVQDYATFTDCPAP